MDESQVSILTDVWSNKQVGSEDRPTGSEEVLCSPGLQVGRLAVSMKTGVRSVCMNTPLHSLQVYYSAEPKFTFSLCQKYGYGSSSNSINLLIMHLLIVKSL